MPLILEVHTPDRAHEVPLTGERITLGSAESADVRIVDATVAPLHASLQKDGGDWLIADEASTRTSGTFVGGVRVRALRIVRPGDRIRLGRARLTIRDDSTEPGVAAQTTGEIALRAVLHALRAGGRDAALAHPSIRVMEGRDRGRVLALEDEGRDYIVGRAEGCALPLEDPEVSREHARMTRHADGVHVRDLGSRQGTELGNERLVAQRDALWKPNQMLRIGGHVLALDLPLDQLIEAALERLRVPGEDEGDASNAEPAGKSPDGGPSRAVEGNLVSSPDAAARAGEAAGIQIAAPAPASPGRRRRPGTERVVVIVFSTILAVLCVAGIVWILSAA